VSSAGQLFGSRDEGKTFAPYVEIDASYNPCNCCTTSSTYAADGRVAIHGEQANTDFGIPESVVERGAAVVVVEDLLPAPPVIDRVAERTELAHAPTVTVAAPVEQYVRSDHLRQHRARGRLNCGDGEHGKDGDDRREGDERAG
jgi:hypothetical protein